MPRKIVDLSARSAIIREEPWQLHFWESSGTEVLAFLANPRGELEKMGIHLPPDCRVETTIENHDWISEHTNHFTTDNGPICGTGGGNTAKNYYKVSFYGHLESEVGRYKKELLHNPDEQEREPR